MYEHEVEKDVVVNGVLDVLDKAWDGVQMDELFPILQDVLGAIAAARSAVESESKKIAKLKFVGKVGTGLANKALDKFIPDEPNA